MARRSLTSAAKRTTLRRAAICSRRVPWRTRFTAGARGARILFLFTPGGFERYIGATSVAARQPTIPPADVTPPENVAEIARAFGTEIFDDTTPAHG
jgi:hypothetical protein